MNPAEVAAMVDNANRLDGCTPPHAFEPTTSTAVTRVPRRYRCTKCGGEVSTEAAVWYARGREHGPKR